MDDFIFFVTFAVVYLSVCSKCKYLDSKEEEKNELCDKRHFALSAELNGAQTQ